MHLHEQLKKERKTLQMLLKFHENCEKVKKLDTKNKTKHCQKFRISHEIE